MAAEGDDGKLVDLVSQEGDNFQVIRARIALNVALVTHFL